MPVRMGVFGLLENGVDPTTPGNYGKSVFSGLLSVITSNQALHEVLILVFDDTSGLHLWTKALDRHYTPQMLLTDQQGKDIVSQVVHGNVIQKDVRLQVRQIP